MENFTPLAGLAGGLLIGGAASLFVVLNGRVLGISGILGGLLGGATRDAGWRLALLGGIVAGPLLLAA
ncbi:MAG: YeeE/YedE family protein, partial [Rhodospirillales bacterium]